MSANKLEKSDHGDTVAAWTSVVIIIVGFCGLTLFAYLGDMNLILLSAGVILVGSVAGPILSMLGFGKKR